MGVVTSVIRAEQILAGRAEEAVRPLGLTFARYEVLMLLLFSQRGELPLGKIGQRLQVGAASVTNAIDRLERDRLVRRRINPDDGRGVLAAITKRGRDLAHEATVALNESRLHRTRAVADRRRHALLPPRQAAPAGGRFRLTSGRRPPLPRERGLTREAAPEPDVRSATLRGEERGSQTRAVAVGPSRRRVDGASSTTSISSAGTSSSGTRTPTSTSCGGSARSSAEPNHGVVMVTGYDEAVSVYTNTTTFSSCNSVTGPFPGFPVPLEGDDVSDAH